MKLLSLALTFALTGCAVNVATTPINGARTSTNLSTTSTSVTKEDCKKGGWQSLRKSDGQDFKNQGECVSYFASGS